MQPVHSHTCKLSDEQASALKALLEQRGFRFRDVPYARYAAGREEVQVVFYESKKLVVQGKGTSEFVEFTLEPEILREARLGYEEVLKPELLRPRIGVDESGKGDFFGPLCVAGVYVNREVIAFWKDKGVKDSKAISSDRKIGDLAKMIRETPGCVATAVPIGNEAYNRLHRSMRSVNNLLAWGHARVIENLLGQRHRMQPWPEVAISDQFAATKELVAGALMSAGRTLELIQRHRAEEDVAVAAASILARDEFVTRLRKLGKDVGVELPKGASAEVERVAREIVAQGGEERLAKVAKMHFRTAFRVRGKPEPPKADPSRWRQEARQRREDT